MSFSSMISRGLAVAIATKTPQRAPGIEIHYINVACGLAVKLLVVALEHPHLGLAGADGFQAPSLTFQLKHAFRGPISSLAVAIVAAFALMFWQLEQQSA